MVWILDTTYMYIIMSYSTEEIMIFKEKNEGYSLPHIVKYFIFYFESTVADTE